MTPSMWIATGAWLALVSAYRFRRSRGAHVALALLGIGCDLGLVIYLEFTRDAIGTAMEFSLGLLQQLHILFSGLALALYLPIVLSGLYLLSGGRNVRIRGWHRRLGITALLLRSTGFLLMFSMWR